jgi:putative membrane-bound dehydrogenase-like protein
MIRPTLVAALLFSVLASFGQASEVVVDGRTFRVPDGFVLERVAGPPLVDRPIVADFDELGRLYVADSSGSNENVKKQEVERPHRIVRLEDTDGDGKFDRSIVFADKMMFPEGAMWLDGSLYVSAPPSIWKLTDTDGDGVADRREEWFQGKTLTGCANDLHGPYAGPDGRIYWCKGAFAPQTYGRPGRKPLVTRAAHIFRSKPDGTEIEPVMTGGMDNPVEVAFTPEGERIFTTTFFQHPGGGNRDGLIHALYGGVYGKVHDVIDGHPRTGPDVLPPLVHLGPAAPSGLARAESDALGSRDSLFAACFNLRKVTRHKLTARGASFSAETDDFLASDDLDFHPTDVLEDADGSLLVIDTGGWYKICCPTSQLVKPDVLGGIYRVRRKDPTKSEDPRGLKLAWPSLTADALAALLGDARPVVRRRAIAGLVKQGEAAIPSIEKLVREGGSTEARRNAVWAACRIDAPSARSATLAAIEAPDASIRQVAIHSAGLWRDRAAWPRLAEALKDPSPAVRRASAEALGRIGEPLAVPALLEAASGEQDWALRHSLTFALIEIGDRKATLAGLSHPKPLAKLAALIALDQMEGGFEGSDALTLLETATDPALRQTLLWIIGRHPEWGAPSAFLEARLASPGHSPGDREELEDQLARFGKTQGVQTLLARYPTSDDSPAEIRLLALRAMARAGLKELPGPWLSTLEVALERGDDAVVRQAIATLRSFTWPKTADLRLSSELRRIATSGRYPTDARLGALAVLPVTPEPIRPESLGFLLEQLAPDRPASSRTSAADILAKAKLSTDQYARLAAAVGSAGPLEFPRLLEAFDKAEGEVIGLKLVEALQRSPVRSTLQLETLKPRLARFGPTVQPRAEALYRAIEADSADRRGQLEDLLGKLSSGDVRRGQAVFNSPKAACVTCHAIGYVGGKLGPDLTRIGQVRAERDLLESIVYPSASFVRSYEPVSVATKDGKVVSGLLRKDSSDEVVIAVAADRDERISREQVEEIQPGTVSVMPAGLDRQLTPGELADLIAFLRACR